MQEDMFGQFSPTDLAYLAGIVDGEGTVTVLVNYNAKTGGQGATCKIMVPNTYEPLIVWLADTFGGRISRYGKIRSAKHKQLYMWYVSATRSAQLLELILPYLKIKRRQAEIVIAVHKLRGKPMAGKQGKVLSKENFEARQPLIAELRVLNKRGVA